MSALLPVAELAGALVGAATTGVFSGMTVATSVVGTATVGTATVGAIAVSVTMAVGGAAVAVGSAARMTMACGVCATYVTGIDLGLTGAGSDAPQATHRIVATTSNLRNKYSAKRGRVCMIL